MLTTIISFIIVLGILVFIHEFGHFISAKKSGIRVEEFALGYGPKLFSHKKGETMYSIRALPLGGFCKMTGEFPDDGDLSDEEKEIYLDAKRKNQLFYQKSVWKRFLVIFMGPFMNFMLAAFLFILIFSVYGLPVNSSQSTILGDIIPGQAAAESGLKPGDKIIAVDGQRVDNWNNLANIIHNSNGKELLIEFQRDANIRELRITPKYNEEDGYVIGIYPQVIREKIGIFSSIKWGLLQTWHVFRLTILGFVQIISRRSSAEIGGPIIIASMVGQALEIGFSNLLNLMAIISINLGIINLLPFPALDGGRLLFIIIEIVRGRPVDPQKEGFVHLIGFALLMVLMAFFVYKDIARIIS
jgi:regulator of sigma E protease